MKRARWVCMGSVEFAFAQVAPCLPTCEPTGPGMGLHGECSRSCRPTCRPMGKHVPTCAYIHVDPLLASGRARMGARPPYLNHCTAGKRSMKRSLVLVGVSQTTISGPRFLGWDVNSEKTQPKLHLKYRWNSASLQADTGHEARDG